MRLRLLQSLLKMNLNRYKPSKEWSAMPQEDLLETQSAQACVSLYLGACRQRWNWLCTQTFFKAWVSSEAWVKALSQWELVCSSTNVYICGGWWVSLVFGIGLNACSAFISAIPQVSLLSWQSGGRCGMAKRRGQAFLLLLNYKSVLPPWTAIRLYK